MYAGWRISENLPTSRQLDEYALWRSLVLSGVAEVGAGESPGIPGARRVQVDVLGLPGDDLLWRHTLQQGGGERRAVRRSKKPYGLINIAGSSLAVELSWSWPPWAYSVAALPSSRRSSRTNATVGPRPPCSWL